MQHKRLRERIWVLPVPSLQSLTTRGTSAPAILASQHRLATFAPSSSLDPPASMASSTSAEQTDGPNRAVAQGSHLALDVEFEQLWAVGEVDGPVVGRNAIEAAA